MILNPAKNEVLEETHHTTDLLGLYQFSISPEQAANPRLYIEIGMSHPGYVPRPVNGYSYSMIQKNAKLGELPFFAAMELSPSDPVTGRVVNPTGTPLANVKVRAFTCANKGNDIDWESTSWQLVDTDADGRFRIESVVGGPCIVWVVPDEFSPRQLVVNAKSGDQGDIRVEPGIRLSGRVVDDQGEPVVGVWVNLEDESTQSEIKIPVASAICRTDMTDKDGQFHLSPLKAGVCSLRISDSPREAKYDDRHRESVPVKDTFVEQKIDLQPGIEDHPFTMHAFPHVSVHGHFVDSRGKPTPGWEIDAFGKWGNQSFFAKWQPDQQGEFTGALPKGLENGQLNAITNEHHSLRIRLRPGGPLLNCRDLKLGAVEVDFSDIQIVKYTSPIVQIAVVDEDGHAVSGAHVGGAYDNGDELLLPVGEPPTHMFFEKQADGRFRSSQMLPNVKTTFTASAEGYDSTSESETLPEAAERQITLTLKKRPKDRTSSDIEKSDRSQKPLVYTPADPDASNK